MKKFIILVSVIMMFAMLAGCGGDTAAESPAPVESAPVEAVTEPSEEVPAQSEPAQSNAPLVIGGAAENEDVEAVAPAEAAAINEEDFVVVINGGELTFDMTMDSVFELLLAMDFSNLDFGLSPHFLFA